MAKIDDAPAWWTSTIAFRRLREKTAVLSSLHWTFALGCVALEKTLSSMPPNNKAISDLGMPFDLRALPETNGELISRLDDRLDLHRLQVLVLNIAGLEAYLQDVIRLHVASLGHGIGPRKLDAVGTALARPVLNSSTVPDMVQYAGDLLSLNLSTVLPSLKRAYKLRCAAAHNGGVVTAKTLKDIPDVGSPLGGRIKLPWSELLPYLKLQDRIASHIDAAVATAAARKLEIEWIALDMKDRGVLPKRDQLWRVLHTTYGIQGVGRRNKQDIEAKAYS